VPRSRKPLYKQLNGGNATADNDGLEPGPLRHKRPLATRRHHYTQGQPPHQKMRPRRRGPLPRTPRQPQGRRPHPELDPRWCWAGRKPKHNGPCAGKRRPRSARFGRFICRATEYRRLYAAGARRPARAVGLSTSGGGALPRSAPIGMSVGHATLSRGGSPARSVPSATSGIRTPQPSTTPQPNTMPQPNRTRQHTRLSLPGRRRKGSKRKGRSPSRGARLRC
jgi:hypothetical protein